VLGNGDCHPFLNFHYQNSKMGRGFQIGPRLTASDQSDYPELFPAMQCVAIQLGLTTGDQNLAFPQNLPQSVCGDTGLQDYLGPLHRFQKMYGFRWERHGDQNLHGDLTGCDFNTLFYTDIPAESQWGYET